MSKPTISAIAAIGQNLELGKGNDLVWRIPADLKQVKELTTGHTLVMGRKTYESIGRPLPNRTNIVVTRNPDFVAEGCVVVDSVAAAIAAATEAGESEIFIFGGAQIYEAALPLIEKLYLTEIDATDPETDIFFPAFKDEFIETSRSEPAEHMGITYSWITYERKRS